MVIPISYSDSLYDAQKILKTLRYKTRNSLLWKSINYKIWQCMIVRNISTNLKWGMCVKLLDVKYLILKTNKQLSYNTWVFEGYGVRLYRPSPFDFQHRVVHVDSGVAVDFLGFHDPRHCDVVDPRFVLRVATDVVMSREVTQHRVFVIGQYFHDVIMIPTQTRDVAAPLVHRAMACKESNKDEIIMIALCTFNTAVM